MRTKLNITEGIFPMPVLMVATYNAGSYTHLDVYKRQDQGAVVVLLRKGVYVFSFCSQKGGTLYV